MHYETSYFCCWVQKLLLFYLSSKKHSWTRVVILLESLLHSLEEEYKLLIISLKYLSTLYYWPALWLSQTPFSVATIVNGLCSLCGTCVHPSLCGNHCYRILCSRLCVFSSRKGSCSIIWSQFSERYEQRLQKQPTLDSIMQYSTAR